jgi:hypothetical protein
MIMVKESCKSNKLINNHNYTNYCDKNGNKLYVNDCVKLNNATLDFGFIGYDDTLQQYNVCYGDNGESKTMQLNSNTAKQITKSSLREILGNRLSYYGYFISDFTQEQIFCLEVLILKGEDIDGLIEEYTGLPLEY